MSHSNLKQIFIILTAVALTKIASQNITNTSTTNTTIYDLENLESDDDYNEEITKNNKTEDVIAVEKYNETVQTKLLELQKEKEVVFVQLSEAIDNAIVSLKEEKNDSLTAEGVEQLTKLKEQIRVMNEVDFKDRPVRRSFNANSPGEDPLQDAILRSMWELSNVHHDKQFNKKRLEHRDEVQERFNSWVERKIQVQKKEKEIDDETLGRETCPNYGRKGKNSNKGKKGKKGKNGGSSKKGKRYPCCKKCCKQSIFKC